MKISQDCVINDARELKTCHAFFALIVESVVLFTNMEGIMPTGFFGIVVANGPVVKLSTKKGYMLNLKQVLAARDLLPEGDKIKFDVDFYNLAGPIFVDLYGLDLPEGDILQVCVETTTEFVFDRRFDKQLRQLGSGRDRSPNYNAIWGNMD